METKELTFGEKLVGLDFNPSGDERVWKTKRLCADLVNLLNENASSGGKSALYSLICQKAIGDILDAQMNVVKVLTFKY